MSLQDPNAAPSSVPEKSTVIVSRTVGVVGSFTDIWQVQAIRSVINPDKLRHLGPLADVEGLRRQLRPGDPGEDTA